MNSRGWRLPDKWPWFILLPLLAFLGANLLLSVAGGASFELAAPFQVDGHLEATGRLRTLATFLLYAAFAIATIIYAGTIVLDLERSHRKRLAGAAVATMVVGAAAVFLYKMDKGDAYFEISFACASLDRIHPLAQAPAAAGAQERKAPAAASPPQAPAGSGGGGIAAAAKQGGEAGEAKPRPPRKPLHGIACPTKLDAPFAIPPWRKDGNNYFRELRFLYAISAILLFLAMPALVWGAIACLALPDSNPRDRHEAWARQTERLNRLLYITAAFLIAGLFFSSARWTWPGYSLHPDDLKPFNEHVRSLVLYLGVMNSVLIASYYLPVAAKLAALRPPQPRFVPAGSAGTGAAGGEKPNPFAAYRTALTILSPAILGLLGELLKFTP